MYSSIYPQTPITSVIKSKTDIKYPEDIQVILRDDRPEVGNLYIGNIQAAQNKSVIQNLQIGAILCVAKGYATKHPKDLVKYTKYAPIEESQNVELGQYLDECVTFITEKLKLTNILIHCVAGTNRSACFAIAFLIKSRNLSLEDAFNQVKSRRKIISPNDHLISQLKKYEQMINSTPNTPSIRLNQPSSPSIAPQKSIRIKTNALDRSNILQVEGEKSVNQSRISGKMKMQDFDDRKSYRTNKSCSNASNIKFNIGISQPKQNRNPEQSMISNKKSQSPSMLNRSFYASSQMNKSYIQQIPQILSQIPLLRKQSSSRQQFCQKVRQLDSKNNQINNKIELIHHKFEDSNKNNKLALQLQLNEINELRSKLNTHQSERKSRLNERRLIHDKSMQNRQVQQYMINLPINSNRK